MRLIRCVLAFYSLFSSGGLKGVLCGLKLYLFFWLLIRS